MKPSAVASLVFALAVLGPGGLVPDARSQSRPAAGPPRVTRLRIEYKENPTGIDAPKPRLSWQIQSGSRGIVQSAYEVRIARSEAAVRAGRDLAWSSSRVASDESTQLPYGGPALVSGDRVYWQVRVWDGSGRASAWSEPAFWEMGLLRPSDWQVTWVEPDDGDDASKPGPAPMLRREFKVNGAVRSARAYVTSHGLYEMHLNGRRVGEDLFTPGWTSYDKRLQYQSYDVTSLLKTGDNAIGVVLADGWYSGELAWEGRRALYGKTLGLLCQIEIRYQDGRKEVVGSDGRWKAATGPILMSEIYHGETYDARLEKPGWTSPGFDDRQWTAVKRAEHRKDDLIAPEGPPVRRIQDLKPVKVFKTPGGDTVADLGQNMVGWVRLKVQGPAGTTVTLRHAEVLDKEGNFYTANLRKAKATVHYTLKGGGVEIFEPHFTFFGFRYVAVDGFPGEVTPEALTGVVVHSQMAPAGEFETSKPLVNQLQRNIVWGQKGNFLDVPTDCPQRDERLGWTGDAEVFFPTAAYNMDVAAFFTKWMKDVAADQFPSGAVPHVVPNVLPKFAGRDPGGAAGWADAATIIPWNMYLAYGDKRVLESQYETMAKWVGYQKTRAGDDYIWDGDFHFGDWLAFASAGMAANDYPGATTGKPFLATAFFARSTDLLRRTALVLGKNDDAARYADLLAKIKAAFRREFVTDAARVGEGTQTAYALALQFDLLPEELRAGAARRLAEDVRTRKHLTTGFLGTPHLCHALSRYGYLDEAYLLLNRDEYPSWLYPVKQGATTIWERWDGQKPDGTFQTVEMNSFNHYAYGAIGDWMYRVMAGIDTDEAAPGYKRILIAPRPGGGFTSVKASHETPYGRVASAWTLADGRFELSVEVPASTKATVRLPKAQLASVTESGKALAGAEGVASPRQEGDVTIVEVGSGRYHFAYPVARSE